MTYCVAMLLDTGMVFLSDSRTNAGVDLISTFRKTVVFKKDGERVIVLQTSGNLAISQAVVSILSEQINANAEGGHLLSVSTLFDAALLAGAAMREVERRDGEALKHAGLEFNANLVVGGQIRGEAPRLFSVYPAGNFIEATADTTYFQLGEAKYGRPIIDRVISRSSSLTQAIKCALISMDSTIRSNLSVGLPLDLVVLRRDQHSVATHMSIDESNPYFGGIRNAWGDALRHAFVQLPEPEWLKER
jgi:putative proteasome-type protease